jgi:hypothetical protein
LRRFLVFALPLLVLTMALFQFVLEMAGIDPDPARLSPASPVNLPGWVTLGTWCLEALGLTALFLLIQTRERTWSSGLMAGWVAWVFRGPLLVVSVVGLGGLPAGPWWTLVLSWWVLYTICGLLLGGLASAARLS